MRLIASTPIFFLLPFFFLQNMPGERGCWKEKNFSPSSVAQFDFQNTPAEAGLWIANNFAFSASSLDSGLVAHYTFNQCDARDETGGGSDGVIFGNPGCRCGIEDDALWLDGLDDYLEFPGRVNKFFTTMDFTVSFYFRAVGYNVFRQSMLSKRPVCDEYSMFDTQLDVNQGEVNTDFFESPDKFYRDISPETDTTEWMHFALVREGQHVFTYINGSLRKEGIKCSGVDISNDVVLSFANSPCLANGRVVRFKGGVDELRVYDRALSEEEVGRLYALHPVEMAEIDCVTMRESGERLDYNSLCER